MVEKSDIFQKRLTHAFGQKLELFSFFCFIENRPRVDVWRCSGK